MTFSIRWLEDFAADSRFALRQLRQAPGFTAVAALSLALGIGASTAIFTLIESTLLRPIPLEHPERLRLLKWQERGGGWVAPNLGYLSPAFGWLYEQHETPDGGLVHSDFSPPVYREFVRDNTVFESLFTFKELGRVTAVVDGSAEPLNTFLVSGDFYRGLEVAPVIGRAIGPENDVKTAEGAVAVISYDYWTRRFARDPSVLGKTVTLNAVPLTIIGVNPEYFVGIEPGAHFDMWVPLSLSGPLLGRSFIDEPRAWQIPIMGRLKPGVSDRQAQSEMDGLFQAQVDADPGMLAAMLKDPAKRPRLSVASGARGIDYLTEHYDRPLLALLALAGLVLLIACANVANLLLSKGASRQREIAVRLALGAGRGRVVRQLLTEGFLLAALAGLAGVILGYAARNRIPALLSAPWKPSPFDTTFDPAILLASLAVTLLTGLLFSLAPAWQSRRVDVNGALKESGRVPSGLSRLRAGRLLVVLQVTLSVLLLAGAGLCVKTFTNLKNISLGFEPQGVLLFTLDLPRLRYPTDRAGPLLAQLQERFDAIPGVRSSTFSRNRAGTIVKTAGEKPAAGYDPYSSASEIGPRFFETMGIPILYGRTLNAHDGLTSPQAVVVNQEFSRRMFPNQDAVGQTFQGSDQVTYEIVGVCADWRAGALRDPIRPYFYSPVAHPPADAANLGAVLVQAARDNSATFEVKATGDEASVVGELRHTLSSVDPDLAIASVRTEAQEIDDALSQERVLAALAAVFGALAVILASIGIYGVMAYAVTRRTHEIGIRLAIGAPAGGIARMILRETMALAAAGAVAGIPAVLLLTPVLDRALAPQFKKTFAYGLKADDPGILALAVVALAVVAFLAGYVPARRAARVDPMTALRHD